MKKIILTVVLSAFLPAVAVAADKQMQNSNPDAPLMSGKHMMNANPNASMMSKKHMMNVDPFSASSKSGAGSANTNEHTAKGYRVVKYKK